MVFVFSSSVISSAFFIICTFFILLLRVSFNIPLRLLIFSTIFFSFAGSLSFYLIFALFHNVSLYFFFVFFPFIFHISCFFPLLQCFHHFVCAISISSDFADAFTQSHFFSFSLSVFPRARLVSEVTFTRDSSTDYTIHKLNRIFVIFNNMMDCFDILNVSYTKYIFCLMVLSGSPAILYCFGRFRLVNKNNIYTVCVCEQLSTHYDEIYIKMFDERCVYLFLSFISLSLSLVFSWFSPPPAIVVIIRTYVKYVKSDDDIATICGLYVIEFLFCGYIPSVTLSSTAMNKVRYTKCVLLSILDQNHGRSSTHSDFLSFHHCFVHTHTHTQPRR